MYSPRALEIFRSRGVEVDANVGLKKPDLLKIIAYIKSIGAEGASQ